MTPRARRPLILSMAIALTVLALAAAPTFAAKTKWVRTQIGDATSFSPSAVATPDGIVHVAWFSFSRIGPFSTGMSISSGTGRKWQTTEITTNDDAYPSIAYDSLGRFHLVASVASGGSGLVYLTDSSGTVAETTITTNPQGDSADIVVGPSGQVEVLETLANPSTLAVATLGPGGWTTTTLPAANPLEASMEIDASGHTHVVWSAFDPVTEMGLGIQYATDSSGSWVAETVTSLPFGFPDVALDANSVIHIVAVGGGGLQEFIRESGTWSSTQLVAGQFADPSFRIDALGHEDIATLSFGETQTIQYLTNGSGTWVSVTAEAGSPESPSLAVRPNGAPYIAFHEPGGAPPTGVYVAHH
jgi:hypothetical protein